MARLYVANVTRQRMIVFYRLDAGQTNGNFTAPKQQSIEPGHQSTVGGDLDRHQLDMIIGQLNVFGMVGEVDVPNNLKGVHALVFNIDRPVSERTIRVLIAHNQEVKIEEGEKRRERLAIAANEQLNAQARQADLPPPPEFDLEIEQMEQTSDEDRIEKGFHIKRDLKEVPSESLRGRGRVRA